MQCRHSKVYHAVVQLLKAGAQVHHVSKDGRSTALHEAVLRSHADLTDLLLRASANPFLENGAGAFSASPDAAAWLHALHHCQAHTVHDCMFHGSLA